MRHRSFFVLIPGFCLSRALDDPAIDGPQQLCGPGRQAGLGLNLLHHAICQAVQLFFLAALYRLNLIGDLPEAVRKRLIGDPAFQRRVILRLLLLMTTLATVLEKLPAMSFQEKSRYLDSLRGCDLLILDDFGMERRTDYAQEQVFSIIDGRYLTQKPLIITTNLSLKEMKDPEDMAEMRIFDRILEVCVPVCFDGPSLRQGKAKEKLALYKELMGR